MDSNTHSTQPPAGLAGLAAAVDELATQDLERLPDGVLAERVLGLRRLVDCLEATGSRSWPAWTPAAKPGPTRAPGLLDGRLVAGPAAVGRGPAHAAVRTARAVFRAPSRRPPRP